MTFCNGSKKAVIYFRYEGEDWQPITSYNPPISYSISQNASPGQCDVFYDVSGTFTNQSYSPWYPAQCRSVLSWSLGNRIFGKIQGIRQNPSGLGYWECFNSKGEAISLKHSGSGRVVKIIAGDTCIQSGSRASIGEYFAYHPPTITEIIRSDGQPDNCGNGCQFEVTDKDGKIIYSRSEDTCPEVKIECGDQCPPNTCECLHNDKKCCIDPNTGKVIKVVNLL